MFVSETTKHEAQRTRFTNNFCPANFEKNHFTKNFWLHWLQKYNLFTVNKWIFTTLKSNLYKNTCLLAMHWCQNSPFLPFYDVFAYTNISKRFRKPYVFVNHKGPIETPPYFVFLIFCPYNHSLKRTLRLFWVFLFNFKQNTILARICFKLTHCVHYKYRHRSRVKVFEGVLDADNFPVGV